MKTKILILNGPNLNLLGKRQPEIYGHDNLSDIEKLCHDKANKLNMIVDCHQSNHEGKLIDWIQDARQNYDGIIINAGAYTHTSIAIYDALLSAELPIMEVHISNIYKREEFRHKSLISPIANGILCGFGILGYGFALEALASHFNNN